MDIANDVIINDKKNNAENKNAIVGKENNVVNNNFFKKFSSREIYSYKRVDRFYSNCDDQTVNTMINIIDSKYHISLRILDWFVTKCSKRRKILIEVSGNDDYCSYIDVHISYKAQLKSYGKRYFDPFRRREKFNYIFKNVSKMILTTIAQLNFFKWIIENNILAYIEKNFDSLSKEMNVSNKNDKKRKKEKTIKKLSNNPTKNVNNNVSDKNMQSINENNNINISVKKNVNIENVKLILTFD